MPFWARCGLIWIRITWTHFWIKLSPKIDRNWSNPRLAFWQKWNPITGKSSRKKHVSLNFLDVNRRFFDSKNQWKPSRNLTSTSLNGLLNAHTGRKRSGGISWNPGKHMHSSRILCQLFGNFNDNCGSVLMIIAARFLDILDPVFGHFWAAFFNDFAPFRGSVLDHFWSGFWWFLGRVFNDFCSILWPGSDSAFHPSWGALGCPGPILMHAHGHGYMKSVRILKYTQICHRRDSPNRKRRPLGSSIERYKGSKWHGTTTLNFCNFDVL